MSESLSNIRSTLSIYVRDPDNEKWTETEKNAAINAAIGDAYPAWFTEVTSSGGAANWLVVCEDRMEYTLPTMKRLLGVAVEICDEYESGTINATTTSALTADDVSWTVAEFAQAGDDYDAYDVVVYTGPGQGEYARIGTNSATALELVTSGYNWSGAAATHGEYMIKNVSDRTRDWHEIWAFRTDVLDTPSTLYLTANYISGMYLKLHYVTAPSELSDDDSETDVPEQWIVFQGAAHLHLMRLQDAPGWEDDVNVGLFNLYQTLADEYRRKHAMRFPPATIRTEAEHSFIPLSDEYPF